MQNILPKLVLASALLVFSMIVAPDARAQSYAVVVNAENSFSGDDSAKRKQIKRLYLKEQTAWPGGLDAVPFGREEGSAEQVAFAQGVLGMSDAEIAGHWLKLKQIRGETQPRGIGSARILARQIGKNPGAFGVVLASEAGGIDGGKVLFEFSAN